MAKPVNIIGLMMRWMRWTASLVVFCLTCAECSKPFLNDQCPDLFEFPLEYRTSVQFMVVNSTSHLHQPCVVITQCSVDRLQNLKSLAKAWNGAVSAAVYVSTASPTVLSENLERIQVFGAKMRKDKSFRGWLSISVLFGHEDSPWRYDCPESAQPAMPLYPINNLRNLAVIGSGGPEGSKFPLYMLLDADFIPSMSLRSWVRTQAQNGLIERCRSGDLIVIPAFETTLKVTHPTLSFVLAGTANGTVSQFHAKRYIDGHAPSNYSMWLQLSEQARHKPQNATTPPTYPVENKPGYEPYVIVHRDRFIPYDERFRGYLYNKIIQLQWMTDRGATYHVLPRHFVIERKHPNGQNYKVIVGQRKLGLSSGLYKTYEKARAEILAGKLPVLSNTTLALLQEHDAYRALINATEYSKGSV